MKKLYREHGRYDGVPFVMTGEFRQPCEGEWYLSGAVPEAYKALAPLDTSYWILQRAIESEYVCVTCKRKLPMEG